MNSTLINNDFVTETTWQEDALQAVKIDPAVLEAQLTVDPNINNFASPEAENMSLGSESSTRETGHSEFIKFEEMIMMQKAALLSLEPNQFEMLLQYAGLLRKDRLRRQKVIECAFCKKNGEAASWYSAHILKDTNGRVRCPVLRGYRCPICGAFGDYAHTIKYCPENPDAGMWSR